MRRTLMLVAVAAIVVSQAALAAGTTAQTGEPTRTIENLRAAVEGEANAAHRYTLFAARADEEGHPQVAQLFRAAAESERIHRRNHELVSSALGVSVPEPRLGAVEVRSTRENLRVPIEGERDEATETYPRYIEQAHHDGVPAAAASFTYAQLAEQGHERLFRDALASIDDPPADVQYWVQSESGILEVRPGHVRSVATLPVHVTPVHGTGAR